MHLHELLQLVQFVPVLVHPGLKVLELCGFMRVEGLLCAAEGTFPGGS